mmetsp:Transcript_5096/g.9099  ORF Transcript_5096/g.9099 Transcript_5096/m.9099 type:complete len:203 (-) Transcript_5096:1006-1614(-)
MALWQVTPERLWRPCPFTDRRLLYPRPNSQVRRPTLADGSPTVRAVRPPFQRPPPPTPETLPHHATLFTFLPSRAHLPGPQVASGPSQSPRSWPDSTDGGGWSTAAGRPVPDGRYRPPGALLRSRCTGCGTWLPSGPPSHGHTAVVWLSHRRRMVSGRQVCQPRFCVYLKCSELNGDFKCASWQFFVNPSPPQPLVLGSELH